ncbi:DUF6197 family protein [Actinomadura rupiterrae]|uniref:DUF6197 family protein n=1 Tax=Actinomadura rupiterrae TaxID=559627 RepID=UPI0020A4BB07|nr:hypothetical protein [Actinomadura rupiterrae]MCP2339231.1 hypothetical protein [Actinomadura rupiterrae]
MLTSQILDKAAEHLETYGWIQNHHYELWARGPIERRACCLVGALNVAETGNPLADGSGAPREALVRHLVLAGDFSAFSLAGWNDDAYRTMAEVLAALRETAEEERGEGR